MAQKRAEPAPAPAAAPERTEPTKPAAAVKPSAPAPAAAPAKASAPAPNDGDRARALLEGKPASAAAADGRFVVQVGAFADAARAREARQTLEKAGLKTYTQVVDTKEGKRIRVRVGPFESRAEADKALSIAKLQSGGGQAHLFSSLKKQGVDNVSLQLWNWTHPESSDR
jgi:DedD protein